MRKALWLALLVGGPAAAQAPAAAPYSIPWQLRPAAVVNVVRLDTSLATMQDEAGVGGTTTASLLLASLKLRPEVGVFARWGVVHHAPPSGSAATVLTNPALGAMYLVQWGESTRLGLGLGLALPLGMGGGNTPDAAELAAGRAGVLGRAAMDNALFAVNDMTVFPGVDVAWVHGGLTVQAEATVLVLRRLRGEALQPDEWKVNLTSGLHVGYFVRPQLSVGLEVRYQRWLSTPASVTSEALRDNLTVALGTRLHLKLGDSLWLRPALHFARPLDTPMSSQGYSLFQLDVPVFF